jgi:hypothetical protein
MKEPLKIEKSNLNDEKTDNSILTHINNQKPILNMSP